MWKSKLKIWKAKYENEPSSGIGKIIAILKDGVKVGTGQGNILLQVVNLDDGKEMLATDLFSTQDIGQTFQ